jgi:cell division protein FtsB
VAVKRFWLAPALLAGAILYAGLDPEAGLWSWWQLRQALEDSRVRIHQRERENQALSDAARDLDGDPFALESAIRVDLGLSRPRETIVYFSGGDASSNRNP